MNFTGEILNDFIAFTKHAEIPPLLSSALPGQPALRAGVAGDPPAAPHTPVKPLTDMSKGIKPLH